MLTRSAPPNKAKVVADVGSDIKDAQFFFTGPTPLATAAHTYMLNTFDDTEIRVQGSSVNALSNMCPRLAWLVPVVGRGSHRGGQSKDRAGGL